MPTDEVARHTGNRIFKAAVSLTAQTVCDIFMTMSFVFGMQSFLYGGISSCLSLGKQINDLLMRGKEFISRQDTELV